MCNAWNHPDDCDCGFGGDTGGWHEASGLRGFVVTRSTDWDARQRLTHPTACWWCQRPVFFYRDENGGCALFDDLGAPWPIHPCWEMHRDQQNEFSGRVRRRLVSQLGGHPTPAQEIELVLAPTGRSTSVRVDGWISGLRDARPRPIAVNEHTLRFTAIHIVDRLNNGYEVLAPFGCIASEFAGSPCTIHGEWVCQRGRWVLLATQIALPPDHVIAGTSLPDPSECRYCGRSLSTGRDSSTPWGFDQEGGIECVYCGNERRALSPAEFTTIMQRTLPDDAEAYRQDCRERLVRATDGPGASYHLECAPLTILLTGNGVWLARLGKFTNYGRWLDDAGTLRLFEVPSVSRPITAIEEIRLWCSLTRVSTRASGPETWVLVDEALAERPPTSALGEHRRLVRVG